MSYYFHNNGKISIFALNSGPLDFGHPAHPIATPLSEAVCNSGPLQQVDSGVYFLRQKASSMFWSQTCGLQPVVPCTTTWRDIPAKLYILVFNRVETPHGNLSSSDSPTFAMSKGMMKSDNSLRALPLTPLSQMSRCAAVYLLVFIATLI